MWFFNSPKPVSTMGICPACLMLKKDYTPAAPEESWKNYCTSCASNAADIEMEILKDFLSKHNVAEIQEWEKKWIAAKKDLYEDYWQTKLKRYKWLIETLQQYQISGNKDISVKAENYMRKSF